MTLNELLKTAVSLGASDLHLTTGSPPAVRVDGELLPLDTPALASAETSALACAPLTAGQRRRFEEGTELDVSFDIAGVGRFRGNLFRQRGSVAAVFRVVPGRIPSLRELGMPAAIGAFARLPRGLVLVTGATGSGKSTTLAALLDTINSERRSHILTVEDPIEFVHANTCSVVNQREVHTDTTSFATALRSALREDPDVVLIGELRDLETIEAALRVAETGHLTFGTLHTNSAARTVMRILDVFPAHQQPQVRAQLALALEGVVCQALLPNAEGGGRVAAVEVLVPTPAIRHLIRDDKVHQLYSAMQAGQEGLGTQTFNQSLARLCAEGRITASVALAASPVRDELQEMINRGVGVVPGAGLSRPGAPARPMTAR